ncbi:hypothetical protein CMQ_3369 [Grosmannia clavigera kw1407]|uniref:DUF7492 domain-containing protein n=1 Tax=Grosmannia clavigera (strain kw1407 / UAMH 11150) TaxID=655863 RepID=F0XAI2_GROCL|nr:uncharacterized protein CMQ_3369 [Grosmannia clavigera kw1407]EFX05300.1 hypothetical protein CMQ_3369 [Grosmannia clavigera kw1407]
MSIDSNGTMVGNPGYIRGYVPRTVSGFSDDMDNYLLPPNGRPGGNILYANDSLCHPSQSVGNYSTEFPMLSVTAGGFIALRYQENGHVTLPDTNPTKPLNRGTVYIYGTTEPSSDELFSNVFEKWTADGTGGNGRGRLLATRNFDDGQCYQVNGQTISVQRQAQFKKTAENPQGTDLWCQNDIQLPANLTSGTSYTLYWVWSWPTMNMAGSPTDTPGTGFNITTLQYYTSCMDVSVASGQSTAAASAKEKAPGFSSSFVEGQDLNSAAVLSQLTVGPFQVNGIDTSSSSNSSSGTATTPSISTTAAAGDSGNGAETIALIVQRCPGIDKNRILDDYARPSADQHQHIPCRVYYYIDIFLWHSCQHIKPGAIGEAVSLARRVQRVRRHF